MKWIGIVLGVMMLSLVLVLTLSACSKGDDAYDSQTITVVFPDESTQVLTIAQLRDMPQQQLDASFKRSTGTVEEYDMEGPLLADVLREAGADIDTYAGVSVGGSDGYYTMLPQDIIQETSSLILAITVDGKSQLNKDIAPAQLAVQGQLGPYWVKMIDTIVLYDVVPEKRIASIWVFDSFARDIEAETFPYFGSDDTAYNLEKIWPMLDNVDSKAFFTMKSSDGYQRNESLNSVLKQYFIKVDGEDAPINVSPNIDPTFGVKNIAWFSTNEDVFIFPDQLTRYCATEQVGGRKAIPLDEICYEVGLEDLSGLAYELVDAQGLRVTLDSAGIATAFLSFDDKGSHVIDADANILVEDLVRICVIRGD